MDPAVACDAVAYVPDPVADLAARAVRSGARRPPYACRLWSARHIEASAS